MCEFTEQWQAHAEARGETRGIEIGKSRGIEIGESQGEFKKAIELIRNLMDNSHVSADVAMNMLGISHQEQQAYMSKLI